MRWTIFVLKVFVIIGGIMLPYIMHIYRNSHDLKTREKILAFGKRGLIAVFLISMAVSILENLV